MAEGTSAAAVLYPTAAASPSPPASTGDGKPTPHAEAAAALYRTNAPPTPMPPASPAEGKEPPTPAESAADLYVETPETFEHVEWVEPAANAGELGEVIDSTTRRFDTFDATADQKPLANAFAEANIGRTFAREVMDHVGRASQPGYEPTEQATAEAELRASWGKNFQRNVGIVQAAVQAAHAKDPRIVPYLNDTGLGNDPAFVKKLYASIQRRRS